MSLRSRFLDWLEIKLKDGIDYCQDRSLYRIQKKEEEPTDIEWLQSHGEWPDGTEVEDDE